MPVQIIIQGDNAAEAHAEVLVLAARFSRDAGGASPAAVNTPVQADTTGEAVGRGGRRRRGATGDVGAAPDEPKTEDAKPAGTVDDLRKLLIELGDKTNDPSAPVTFLKELNAKKLSDLPVDKLGEAIEKARAAIENAGKSE